MRREFGKVFGNGSDGGERGEEDVDLVERRVEEVSVWGEKREEGRERNEEVG